MAGRSEDSERTIQDILHRARANGTPDTPFLATAVQVILAYFQQKYSPIFRRGTSIHSGSEGREIKSSEALLAASSELIELLKSASNVPRDRYGVIEDKLPAVFRRWAPTAWKDLLEPLKEEARTAEIDPAAQEAFQDTVLRGLLAGVTLHVPYGTDGAERLENRPLLEWARMFAKTGCWSDVRGRRIWSQKTDSPPWIRVALRVELFGGQSPCPALAQLTYKDFAALCEAYSVGARIKVEGGSLRAVELTPEFLTVAFAKPEMQPATSET